MPKIESENQFLMSIKGRNYVLICPAESENDALTDWRTDVQRAVLTGWTFWGSYGPWPLQIHGVNLTRLTPQAHFNPITPYCTNPNLTKHGCTDC